jgi:hypothetical protein
MKFDNFSACRNISKIEIENPDFISKWLKYEGCEKTLKKWLKRTLLACHVTVSKNAMIRSIMFITIYIVHDLTQYAN